MSDGISRLLTNVLPREGSRLSRFMVIYCHWPSSFMTKPGQKKRITSCIWENPIKINKDLIRRSLILLLLAAILQKPFRIKPIPKARQLCVPNVAYFFRQGLYSSRFTLRCYDSTAIRRIRWCSFARLLLLILELLLLHSRTDVLLLLLRQWKLFSFNSLLNRCSRDLQDVAQEDAKTIEASFFFSVKSSNYFVGPGTYGIPECISY